MTDSNHSSMNEKILACVDGSIYTDSVCAHTAWASQRLNAPVQVLHLLSPGTDYTRPSDYSGAIGLGVKSALLEKLTQLDEAQGKLEQQKGKLILEHAKEMMTEQGVSEVHTLHRRGSLVETISEIEGEAQLIVLGKRGEDADFATMHLGSNLERSVRAAHKPVLVASRGFQAINRFVIAYDGGPSIVKAMEYALSKPLLKGLECHLLKVGADTEKNQRSLADAATTLERAGYSIQTKIAQGQADEVIADYVKSQEIDLLIMGAYGHSHIRTLIIGSTTSSMLRTCLIPVLMFR
ncbi:MAG: universal stress protein [Chloroflexota bacterium]